MQPFSARSKYRQLLIGMLITTGLLLGGLLLGAGAGLHWAQGQTATGRLHGLHSQTVHGHDGDDSTLNTATVSYRVGEREYAVEVNTHLYGEFDLLERGEQVTVAYPADAPGEGEVLDWLLFSPFAPFLVGMGGIGLLLQLLQWPYYRARARAEAATEAD